MKFSSIFYVFFLLLAEQNVTNYYHNLSLWLFDHDLPHHFNIERTKYTCRLDIKDINEQSGLIEEFLKVGSSQN